MAFLECENDALTQVLNARRYEPILMPRTDLQAPEVWVFDNDSLVRWGPLSGFVPTGSLPTKLEEGSMGDLDYVETSKKGMKAAAGFLGNALKCIGIDSAPKLDMSFSESREIHFSFSGVTTRGMSPASLGAALSQFSPGIIPKEQVSAGMVHVAYEYAYASTLNMRFVSGSKATLDLKALQIDRFIDLGGKVDIETKDATTLSFKSKATPAAFALKVGQLVRQHGKWAFNVTEILGYGATADESSESEPYLLRRGAVLIGVDRAAT